jgi:cyclohexa-1,5-dienecarbonyl-CoA hydratase
VKTYKSIKASVDGNIARLILARPPLNILNIAMMRELCDAMEDLERRADVRVVVLSGEGKGFSAGVDVGEHVGDGAREMIDVFHGMFRRLDRIEAPVVGAIHGMALGGGCELALFCDLVLASADCKIGQPEVQVGVFPPLAAAVLPRRLGWQAAADLVLTGRVVRGEEARQMGLVARTFPPEAFAAEAEKAVRGIAGLSGSVLRTAKKALRAAAFPALDALEAVERIYLEDLMKTEDAAEGLRAFMEKRAPVWKDR